jgi:hypothetical protein
MPETLRYGAANVATYPYTYLASFMNQDFQAVVVAQAVKDINKASGALRQRLDRAVRSAGVNAPGYRPGKIPLNQVGKPLVTPIRKNSPVTPFNGNEEIAHAIFALWVESKADLRGSVAAFLQQKGLAFSEELPEEGFAETLKASEMEALAGEIGASSDVDSAVYDDTALMLVCLLGRAPVPDEAMPEEEQPPAAPRHEGAVAD